MVATIGPKIILKICWFGARLQVSWIEKSSVPSPVDEHVALVELQSMSLDCVCTLQKRKRDDPQVSHIISAEIDQSKLNSSKSNCSNGQRLSR